MSPCAPVSRYCNCFPISHWLVLIINHVIATGLLQSYRNRRRSLTVNQYMTWLLWDLYGVLKLQVPLKASSINLELFKLPEILCHVLWTCACVFFHPQGIRCCHRIYKVGHDEAQKNHWFKESSMRKKKKCKPEQKLLCLALRYKLISLSVKHCLRSVP